jgi:uncharacterized delta-60 repeat protein
MTSKNHLSFSSFRIKNVSAILCLILFSISTAFTQTNQVDLTFNAATGKNLESNTSLPILQPDGKIIVVGQFNNLTGVAKNKIARLNSNGTLDTNFDCACESFEYVSSAVVQQNGKIIIAGSFGDGPSPRIVRLNSDGSRDFSFNSPFSTERGGAEVLATQPDGKTYITLSFGGFRLSLTYLYRLNPDGSFDTTFNYLVFDKWGGKDLLSNLIVLPDGKLLISGKHNYGYLFRVNTDGSKDNTFENPSLVGNGQFNVPPYIYDFDFQSDGKIVVIGSFISINGISRSNFARLNVDGSVDTQFSTNFQTAGRTLEVLSNDKILATDSENSPIHRLNPDGTIDNTFNLTPPVTNWILDSLERIVIIANFLESNISTKKVARLTPDGTLDNTFSPANLGVVGAIGKIALQPDGKVLVSGYFTHLNGIVRSQMARVNSDGTLDTTFSAQIGVGNVENITVLSNGKILVGGRFYNFGTTVQQNLVRLNSDGSLDSSFTPIITPVDNSSVKTIAVQTDGKIIIGGSFTAVNSVSRNNLARFNTDGTLDTTFNPSIGGSVYSLIAQPNGKIVVAGGFSGVNGFNRSNLVRLNTDGSLDSSFNAGTIPLITQILVQPDGKYLSLTGTSILRRNADGTNDSTLQSPTFSGLSKILLQPDGSIIVVGNFTSVNEIIRNNIARITSNGELDTLFYPTGSNDRINDIIAQTDGKLIVGGNFSVFERVDRSGLARFISPTFARKTPWDFDGDGRADIVVYRPSNFYWYKLLGTNYQFSSSYFGANGDLLTPADFDGDGKTDIAIFRPATADWVYGSSANNGSQFVSRWGQNGDIPLPSDFNGDGKADFVVFRPSALTWYRYANGNGLISFVGFGAVGDKPVIGDFDGDGKSDPAVFRPSSGEWFYAASSQSGVHLRVAQWGLASDKLVPADYDGDGKTDAAIYRNGLWAIYNSSNGSNTILTFGQAGDIPVAADYDGDGKADVAVYRPSNGAWYLLRSTQGFSAITFGTNGDIPIPSAYVQ